MKRTDLPEWKRLARLAEHVIGEPLADFVNEAERFSRWALTTDDLLLDLSKHRVTDEIGEALLSLALACDLPDCIEALFAGDRVNNTEDRPALHTALRAPGAERPDVARDSVQAANTRVTSIAEDIRSGAWRGFTGRPIDTVVHIGIGGSHLGPELVVTALHDPASPVRVRFVANVDGNAINAALRGADAERTLIVMVSKSFTTLETQVNASAARQWLLERLGSVDALAQHFLAVTSNVEAAQAFGLPEDNLLPMWDWIGGRYSLWSAVGLPIALHCGPEAFASLLDGAHATDTHFRTAPLQNNLPVMAALIGIWNTNFLGANNHAVLAYDDRLALLPDYLQQLEMESNGKSVDRDGAAVHYHTMPILWGNVGTNGQHAFHQLLHQGTRAYTADYIACAQPAHGRDDQHRWLLANALAQSQAMMQGDPASDPHKRVQGNRASTTLLLRSLTPQSLGALLAFYEHKVFCQGVIWNINSFDQWGVELGKRLARPIRDQLNGRAALEQDTSTRGLIDYLRRMRYADASATATPREKS